MGEPHRPLFGPSSPAGIQWAQLNVTGGAIATTPGQQQLYPGADDGLHRWMGSLAVDWQGDIALGYSAANSVTSPDIRYAGRFAADPANTLPQTETTLLPGVTRGAQTGNCGGSTCTRWGDYSAMTLDPDGCTFWFTQEYYATTELSWNTRIGSFRFPSCRSSQTIAFGALANRTFGDADFAATVHLTGAGSCTVTASQTGDVTYGRAFDVSQTFSIAKAIQTIALAPLDGKTYGDGDFAVTATASSGLATALAAAGNCTVSGVHLTAADSCTVSASQSGDANYNAAADVAATIAVAKAAQTIAFGPLSAKRYGAADFTVTASTSSGLPASFSAGGKCTVNRSTVHLTGAGSCVVTASQAGDSNFDVGTSVLQSFNVTACIVPSVVGKTLAHARTAIAKRGCRTGRVRAAHSARGKGKVISQDRRAGRLLPSGSKINLVVSRGAKR